MHALIGENGAGKSDVDAGPLRPLPAGPGPIPSAVRRCEIHSPRDAIALGIGMVHQHFVLVDRFTVTENIILGAEGGPLLDMEAAHAKVAELATRFGFGVRPSALVEELSVGEEQRIES